LEITGLPRDSYPGDWDIVAIFLLDAALEAWAVFVTPVV
jgi:hypothetical protein